MSRVEALESHPAYKAGGFALALALGAILTALGFEYLGGVQPCPLCLQQRWAFYAGVPALFLALVLVGAEHRRAAALVFFLVALAFLANTGLATYHAGVEWKFWAGPDTCSQVPGALQPLGGGGSILDSIKTARVVRCDEPSGRFLGLSFAGWNVVGSFLIFVAALQAAFGATEHKR